MANSREKEHVERSKAYLMLSRSPEGRLIMEDLEAQFGGTVATDDPHTTAIRAGHQEVLAYIRDKMAQMNEYVEKAEGSLNPELTMGLR